MRCPGHSSGSCLPMTRATFRTFTHFTLEKPRIRSDVLFGGPSTPGSLLGNYSTHCPEASLLEVVDPRKRSKRAINMLNCFPGAAGANYSSSICWPLFALLDLFGHCAADTETQNSPDIGKAGQAGLPRHSASGVAGVASADVFYTLVPRSLLLARGLGSSITYYSTIGTNLNNNPKWLMKAQVLGGSPIYCRITCWPSVGCLFNPFPKCPAFHKYSN